MATAATIDVLLKANTASYRAAMIDAGRTANRELGNIRKEVESTARSFETMKRAAVGVISVQALRAGVGAMLDTVKANQALVNSMKASVGSAEASAQALAFVGQTAKELGLDYESAARGFQRMTASASANGIAMRDQQQLFLEVSRAATALQLAPAQVDRAMTALAQSFSKGRFQAEELRQQLAEAVPGAVPRFQKAVLEMTKGTDLAGKSFDELLQGGLLDVKTFLPAMTAAFAEMGASWRDASGSLQAETNRLGNAWRKFKLELADGPFSDAAVGGIRAATVALEGMGAVLPALVPAVTALAAVKIGQATAEWVRGLNAAHAANLAQAVSAEQAAAALVQKTRAEMLDAQATAARARAAYGGSIAADLAATQATNAHSRALAAHAVASEAAAVASNRLALAGKAALGFFGGPAGLAFMVVSTAASWLLFSNNTDEASRALVDFSGAADQAITKFRELNKQQQAGELLRLNRDIQEGYDEVNSAIGQMVNTISDLGLQAGIAFPEYLKQVRALEEQFRRGQLNADQFSERIADLNHRSLEGARAGQFLTEAFTEQEARLGTLARDTEDQRNLLGQLTGAQHSAANAARDHASGMIELSKASQEATSRIQAALSTLPGQIERIGKSARQVAALDVRDWFRQLAKDGVNFADGQSKQVQEAMAQAKEYIRLQNDLATKTEAHQEAQRNLAKAARDAAREQKEAAKEAKKAAELRQRAVEAAEREAERVFAMGQQFRRQLEEQQRSRQMGNEADLLGIGSGAETVERMRRLIDLQEEYAQAVRDLNYEALVNKDVAAAYDERLRMLNDYHRQALDGEAEYQRRLSEMQADWTNGARAAFEDYIAAAKDVAGQTRDIFSNTFQSLEQTIVDFLQKGSADWKGFFDDLHRQILQFIVRQQLSKWMQSIMGGTTSSANYGEMAGSIFDLFAGDGFGFAQGGYTGPGGKFQPKGIVHAGEGVLSQPEIAAIGGESGFNALRVAIRRGYADGGFVGGSSRVEVAKQQSRASGRHRGAYGADFNQTVNIQVEGRVDNRTKAQIAAEVGRESRRAMIRNGG